eukprot:s702_g7.t1
MGVYAFCVLRDMYPLFVKVVWAPGRSTNQEFTLTRFLKKLDANLMNPAGSSKTDLMGAARPGGFVKPLFDGVSYYQKACFQCVFAPKGRIQEQQHANDAALKGEEGGTRHFARSYYFG